MFRFSPLHFFFNFFSSLSFSFSILRLILVKHRYSTWLYSFLLLFPLPWYSTGWGSRFCSWYFHLAVACCVLSSCSGCHIDCLLSHARASTSLTTLSARVLHWWEQHLAHQGTRMRPLYKRFGHAADVQSAADEIRAFACHLDTFFSSPGKIRVIHLLLAFKVMKGCVFI